MTSIHLRISTKTFGNLSCFSNRSTCNAMPFVEGLETPYLLTLGAFVLLVIIPWLYYRLLPRPILGIPYDKRSSTKLFGDIPDVCNLENVK
jgi:hypothetical protein